LIYNYAQIGLSHRQDKTGFEAAKTLLKGVMDGETRVWAQISTLYGIAVPFVKP